MLFSPFCYSFDLNIIDGPQTRPDLRGSVTPRSRGSRKCYCDVYTQVKNTLTYIHSASVQERIRVRKQVVHYTFWHMSTITKLSQDVTQYYKNIISPIGANARVQRDIQLWTVQKALTSYKRKVERQARGAGRIGPQTINCWSTTLLLRNSDQQKVHYGPNSGIWTCRFRVGRSNLTSGKLSAKWRARIGMHASINLSQNHVLKIVLLWTQAYRSRQWGSK